MPPPVLSVEKTSSSENLPMSVELECIVEEPVGRIGAKKVTVAEDEGCWCCNDFFGCDDGRFYCSKFSVSLRHLCCCFVNSKVVEATVDFVADMKANVTPTAMQPVLPSHSPPTTKKEPCPPPQVVNNTMVNTVVYLDVGDGLS